MAEKVETLEQDLTCPICVDVFREPVLLPCQHSFCRECLEVYNKKGESQSENGDSLRSEPGAQKILCPVCRSSVDLGAKGVAGLPLQLTLVSIVEKYRSQVKLVDEIPPCSICEDEVKQPAVKVCVTCSIFYCQDCVTVLHPMRGTLRHHELITVQDYLCQQHNTATTGTKDGAIDTSDQCDDHGLEILLFCEHCQRLLCKNCFRDHDGHTVKDLFVLYEHESKLLEEKTAALEQIKGDVEKMTAKLLKFQTDIEEKKSLHIVEIEKAYREAIEAVNEWRKDSLKSTKERHEKWRLACIEATKSLELKKEELESLVGSSKELLSGKQIPLLRGRNKLTTRIDDDTTSTKNDLLRHRDVTTKCRDDMNSDAVIPRQLHVKEETISTPRLKFSKKLSDCVLIKDNGTTLVSVKHDPDVFKGALTDGRLFTGCHYWELDLSFNVKKTQPEGYFIYTAGVLRNDSDIGVFVGHKALSCGVTVLYLDDQCMFTSWDNTKCLSTPVPVYPDSVSERGTVRQGFYLNCEKRTLTVIDLTHNRVLCTFRDLDLAEPLIPAVSVHNYDEVDVSVRLIPCNLSGLVMVLHDSGTHRDL